jgi:prevent-host-death family protein
MRTITQRQLRNESAEVMDAVEHGETVLVTRNGRPVAELRPVRLRRFVPTTELVEEFRGLPRVSLRSLRGEADALFGEDRVDA